MAPTVLVLILVTCVLLTIYFKNTKYRRDNMGQSTKDHYVATDKSGIKDN